MARGKESPKALQKCAVGVLLNPYHMPSFQDMSISFNHSPVMADEVMTFFADAKGKTLVDTTAGGGGHLSLLARAVGEDGLILAFDQDPRAHQDDAALGVAKSHKNIIRLFHRPFSKVKDILGEQGVTEVDGLICDLGVSSNQLDDRVRGFSFLADGPIDMRMDPTQGQSAYRWLETTSESDIADALFQLGGERKSRAIAKAIKTAWPLENSTLALAKLVIKAIRRKTWSKIHPATRTFQAIRMAVNNEMGELSSLLHDLEDILAVGGTAVFLSFHSVEDRLIKQAFNGMAKASGEKTFTILTKKPLIASSQELAHNRRARSAKLRAIRRIL